MAPDLGVASLQAGVWMHPQDEAEVGNWTRSVPFFRIPLAFDLPVVGLFDAHSSDDAGRLGL